MKYRHNKLIAYCKIRTVKIIIVCTLSYIWLSSLGAALTVDSRCNSLSPNELLRDVAVS